MRAFLRRQGETVFLASLWSGLRAIDGVFRFALASRELPSIASNFFLTLGTAAIYQCSRASSTVVPKVFLNPHSGGD